MDVVTLILALKKSKKYTDNAIAAIAKGMTYKGSVATVADLPLTGNTKGDVYTVSANRTEYVWTIDASSGTVDNWEPLSGNAYQEFPSTWAAATSADSFFAAVNATNPSVGSAYLGQIAWGSDMPFSGNGEVTLTVSADGAYVLVLTSLNVSPYHWEMIGVGSSHGPWRSWESVSNKTTSLTAESTNVQYPGALAVYNLVMANRAIPENISTAEGMNAVLIADNVGKVYRYTGVTTTDYTNGDLYEVEEA